MAQKQLPVEFKEFIQSLNSAKVKYLVLGGWAVSLYSEPRATADIDFFIGTDTKNIDRILLAFTEFGLSGISKDYFVEADKVIRMGAPPTRIELLTVPSQTSVTQLPFYN